MIASELMLRSGPDLLYGRSPATRGRNWAPARKTFVTEHRMKSIRKRLSVVSAAAALLLLAACQSSVKVGDQAVAGLTPDATVEMQQVQVAYIASGGGGTGTIFYKGRSYPFTIGGLGIGGIGASTIEATGEVYKMPSLAEFPGAYASARYGFALGTKSAGDLWLQNEAGVIMHLKAKREGLMLSLGGDAIVISMK